MDDKLSEEFTIYGKVKNLRKIENYVIDFDNYKYLDNYKGVLEIDFKYKFYDNDNYDDFSNLEIPISEYEYDYINRYCEPGSTFVKVHLSFRDKNTKKKELKDQIDRLESTLKIAKRDLAKMEE